MKKTLKEIIKILEDHNLEEIIYEKKDVKIKVKKPNLTLLSKTALSQKSIGQETSPKPIISGIEVKAPLVGIFFSASSIKEKPFVKIGQKVIKGDVLCIIEAMKVMNEIEAPCSGTIQKIFPDNESLVEYDQVIMVIV